MSEARFSRSSKNTRRRSVAASTLATTVMVLLTLPFPGQAVAQGGAEHGVYVRLIEGASGSVADVSGQTREALTAAGFEVVGERDLGVDSDACGFGARVLVVHDEEYTRAILAGGEWAAFALPLRVSIHEDEAGVHVAMANPRSLNRTIVSETEVVSVSDEIVSRIAEAVSGIPSKGSVTAEFGQMRSEGLIGKTMGIMAGGPFESQVEEIASIDADEVGGVAGAMERLSEIEAGSGQWRWRVEAVYAAMLVEGELGVVGVSGDRMEADAFQIVGEGLDEARRDMACPGLDHAAAFPVELVVRLEDDEVKIYLVDEMFRMKMYFEDAGKMKFAANMRMPGAIESEIRDKVDEILY